MNHEVSIINTETGEFLATACVEQITPNTIKGFPPSFNSSIGEAAYWNNGQWTLKIKDAELFFESVRATREELLAETDWTQVSDVKLSDELKASVASYRQALRDITKQDPNNFAWPKNPLAK